MQIRTPPDLGLVICDRHRKLKLTQTDLAHKAGENGGAIIPH